MKRSAFLPALAAIAALLLFGCLLLSCNAKHHDSDQSGPTGETDDDNGPVDDDADDDSAADDDERPPADPMSLGPYQVGNRSLVLVDESRIDAATGKNRTLLTEVWYPAVDSAADLPRDVLRDFFGEWADYVLEQLAAQGASADDIANFERETGSARNAAMKSEDGPFPMILFSHGLAGIRFQNYTTCEYLASHGFVIVAPDHTGSAMVSCLPDEVVIFREDLVPISYRQRKQDLLFLVDKFLELNDYDPDGLLTGVIDPEKIGAFGHSFGGTCVVEETKDDPRIRATVDLASFMFPWLPPNFSASYMFMIGLEDNTMGDVTFLMRYAYDISVPPKFKLELKDAGHYTFTDTCILLPSLMGDGDGCGTGERRSDGAPFTFISHDDAMKIINPYLTAFFGYNLRHEEHMKLFMTQNHFPDNMNYDFEMPAKAELGK